MTSNAAKNDTEQSLGLESEFEPSQWLSKTIEEKGLKKDFVTTYERKKTFRLICNQVKEELQSIIIAESVENDQSSSLINEDSNSDDVWLNRQHQAVIGDKQAISYFITKINEVLQKENITSDEYPSFYDSLPEAIFHEVWGVSILHKWDKEPNSESAVIRGTELWIDKNGYFQKQPEEFESTAVVNRIKKAFQIRTKEALINEQQPELEIEREDGSRITMMMKPRTKLDIIVFRRFVIKNNSLEEQARLGTIPQDDVPFYRALSRSMANTIFAGRVRSAKTTFMKSMIRERPPEYTIAVLEKHFELNLTEDLKDRLIYEVQATEGDLHHAVPRLLRMEHDYITVGEIRSLETEGYLQACERGERGAFSTYHLTAVKNIVAQITRHLLDEFPNRKFDNEQERVARNIDLVISLSAERDRRKKRVIGVTEIIWDEIEKKPKEQDLVRYHPISRQYYYSSNISKELLYLMAEESVEDTKILLNHLKKKEKLFPMSEYERQKDNILNDLLDGALND